jgi:hypothetical protein
MQGGQHYFWYIRCVSYVRNQILDEALHVQKEESKVRKRRKRRR